jgi:hypothetical protein
MFMPAPRAGAVTTRALTNPASPTGTLQARRRGSCAIADLNIPPRTKPLRGGGGDVKRQTLPEARRWWSP